MKKTLIALAAVAVSSAAFAQATISGSIHVGIIDDGTNGQSAIVNSLGGGVNAINIGTTEDLGNGLRAGFTGQIRFNGANGNAASASGGGAEDTAAGTPLFHAANIFVTGNFGTVRIGKIAEASLCAFDPWACTGGAALQAGVGVGGGGAGGLIATGTQAHSLSYTTPSFSGFSASYQTSMSPRSNERQVLSLNYAQGPIRAALMRVENGAASGANAITVAGDVKGSQTGLGLSYDFGVASAHFVHARTKNALDVEVNKINTIGAIVPLGSFSILAGYSKDSALASDRDTKVALGVVYPLSKRTTLGADVFRAENPTRSTGYVLRVRHTF